MELVKFHKLLINQLKLDQWILNKMHKFKQIRLKRLLISQNWVNKIFKTIYQLKTYPIGILMNSVEILTK
jgi:hypothetical protein